MRRCIDGRFLIVAAVGRCYVNGRPVGNVLPVNGPQVVNDAVFHGFYGILTGCVEEEQSLRILFEKTMLTMRFRVVMKKFLSDATFDPFAASYW